MATIFSKIIQGEIPCYKIYEDENHLAFLDINPIKDGHALVIPKKEIDYIFDLNDADIGALMITSKKVAHKIQSVVPCERIGVMVAGLEVPHVHVHLVPIDDVGDLNFAHAQKASHQKLTSLAAEISKVS